MTTTNTPSIEPGAFGDAADPAVTADPPLSELVRSVPALTTLARIDGDNDRRRRVITGIKGKDQPTQALIARLHITTDPLVLWALHLALDARNIPPCLRWPANTTTDQAEYLAWLADLLWVTRCLPRTHQAKHRSWQDILKLKPASPAWHESALEKYLWLYPRGQAGYGAANGLALDDNTRADLMMMPTNQMRRDREPLAHYAYNDNYQKLIDYGVANPDKSGHYDFEKVAIRRLHLWRTWLLCGKSPTITAQRWALLTGETMTRQTLTRHVGQVRRIIGKRPADRPAPAATGTA